MNGSMPNDGSDDVEAHVFPNRKGISPIFFIAGMPDIIRYTVGYQPEYQEYTVDD